MGPRLDRRNHRVRTKPAGGGAPGSRGVAVVWALVACVPLTFLAIFFAWPVATLIGRGLFEDGRLTLEGFAGVFATPRTWRVIGTSLSLAVWGTVLSVVLGVPGAYVLYRTRFPGRGLLRAFMTIPFVMPTVVAGVAMQSLLGDGGPLEFLGLGETFAGIVLALVWFNYSVIVRTVGGMWARLDPRMPDAARTLGASGARLFLTITLPSLAPAIASGAAIVFLFCASAFGVVMIMGGIQFGTIETEIWYLTTQLLDLKSAAALSIVQLVVVTASLYVANETQARQRRALRLRTDESGQRRWRARSDLGASLLTGVVIGGLLAAPLITLVVRSLRVGGRWGLDHYAGLATSHALSVPATQAIANSLIVGVQAASLAVALGLMVSFVLSRRPRSRRGQRALRTLDSAFMLPLGVSAVTVGFGFLITLNRPPLDLRSSMVLIPIAQAIVALPMVVRSLLPVLRAIDPRQKEAAATLGAGPGRVLATIDGPYALRGLGLAVGFALATSLGEFGATSFLSRADAPTLPIMIFKLIGRPGADNYGMAMAASVVLAVLTGVIMALAERLRPKEATGW